MRRARHALAVPLVLAPLAAAACTSGAAYTVYSENDLYGAGNRDRYYTNGLRVTGLYTAAETPEALSDLAAAVPSVSRHSVTQVGWVAGQDIYTPADTSRGDPDPHDRPYAGWLYAGVLIAKAVHADDDAVPEDRRSEGDRVHVLEVDVGVVGPPSLAAQTQISFHHLIGVDRPNGWSHQLRFEPGLDVKYEYRRRFAAGAMPLSGVWDLIAGGGASLGNVRGQLAAGAMARWGNDLRRDFGPNTIHSTAVDVSDGRRGADPRWYGFAGYEGRVVGWNLFLDGNTFRDSPSVPSNPLVGEFRAGVALEWNAFRLAYTHIVRSLEFRGQDGFDAYGSIALTWEAQF